jgi:hypothetical protein
MWTECNSLEFIAKFNFKQLKYVSVALHIQNLFPSHRFAGIFGLLGISKTIVFDIWDRELFLL